MPKSPLPTPENTSKNPDLLPNMQVDEILDRIRDSHCMYCHLINIEIWAIVETMDQFFPGSWGRFMANRQVSLKQFLQNRSGTKAHNSLSLDIDEIDGQENSVSDEQLTTNKE